MLTFQLNMYHLWKLGHLLCAHLSTRTIVLIFACKGTSALRTLSYHERQKWIPPRLQIHQSFVWCVENLPVCCFYKSQFLIEGQRKTARISHRLVEELVSCTTFSFVLQLFRCSHGWLSGREQHLRTDHTEIGVSRECDFGRTSSTVWLRARSVQAGCRHATRISEIRGPHQRLQLLQELRVFREPSSHKACECFSPPVYQIAFQISFFFELCTRTWQSKVLRMGQISKSVTKITFSSKLPLNPPPPLSAGK